MSKLEQFKELKAGCEIVVATPGRLIDMIKMKALTMLRATYLVLDEADRMFDLGFEPQIRSIVGQIRPDRQTLLFSATMPRKVEKLAREILSDPVRVTVGEVGMANEDITQVVQVIPSDTEKLPWLLEKLPGMIDEGDVLVFASKKATVDEVESQLVQRGFKAAALHGDKDQASRMEILQKFKSGTYHVLIATDVAARGLDIKSIKSVVNFDIAKDMDMHVHRIGRTGRAGDKDGTAYTLITQKEARFAGELVNSLIAAGQNVSTELMDLAMKVGKELKEGEVVVEVLGVDYGLGIGYSPESNAASSVAPTRSAAVNSLRTGMMAQFRNNFVPASSNSQNQFVQNSTGVQPNKRMVLPGFVSEIKQEKEGDPLAGIAKTGFCIQSQYEDLLRSFFEPSLLDTLINLWEGENACDIWLIFVKAKCVMFVELRQRFALVIHKAMDADIQFRLCAWE
ncbi:UNVERIFIED_CONTAM: DEAD-box ATP-dependent RNA helicase 24 [Sesamum radiatum]|uniref:RNA helicase n=1 Tax=Sesamum radiatum TaxID=300843 RepID=A0AAW2W6Z5_SESRA